MTMFADAFPRPSSLAVGAIDSLNSLVTTHTDRAVSLDGLHPSPHFVHWIGDVRSTHVQLQSVFEYSNVSIVCTIDI